MVFMSAPIPYQIENGLWGRFISHAELGLAKTIQAHEISAPELIGDMILWTIEDLPKKIWDYLTEARVVTVALTALSLLANSFLFYPIRTWSSVKAFCHLFPIPFWAARFTSYFYTCMLILGYGLRAYGRFSNPDLMNQFYHPKA
jgi:hypothetical protein